MGQDIEQHTFTAEDFARFAQKLNQSHAAIAALLARPGFGAGDMSMGAELEMSLIDAHGHPERLNQTLLAAMNDPCFTAEINRFNLEYNAPPLPVAGTPFQKLGEQIAQALRQVREHAIAHDARPLTVGILPSLRATDLGPEAMTPLLRYRVLNQILRDHRGRPFRLNINGADPLQLEANDVTYEGANTSLQLHLKLPPERFVATYNAAQLALGPVLAIAGNSPLFLQHRLWEETRIVVFKQSVDDRSAQMANAHTPSRVGLGTQWWEGTLDECLRTHLQTFDPLLPICGDEDITNVVAAGDTPKLAEWRTHNGTIWHWNRPVYDDVNGGHLRIEFRALPAGPTVTDMLANAAFMLGLTLGLAESLPAMTAMPFDKAEFNMYRGAQQGLRAQLCWPCDDGEVCQRDVVPLIAELLPLAHKGLTDAGISKAEADAQLAVIDARLANGQTGSRWQNAFLTATEQNLSREDALLRLVNRYDELAQTNQPVHTWPVN